MIESPYVRVTLPNHPMFRLEVMDRIYFLTDVMDKSPPVSIVASNVAEAMDAAVIYLRGLDNLLRAVEGLE